MNRLSNELLELFKLCESFSSIKVLRSFLEQKANHDFTEYHHMESKSNPFKGLLHNVLFNQPTFICMILTVVSNPFVPNCFHSFQNWTSSMRCLHIRVFIPHQIVPDYPSTLLWGDRHSSVGEDGSPTLKSLYDLRSQQTFTNNIPKYKFYL